MSDGLFENETRHVCDRCGEKVPARHVISHIRKHLSTPPADTRGEETGHADGSE